MNDEPVGYVITNDQALDAMRPWGSMLMEPHVLGDYDDPTDIQVAKLRSVLVMANQSAKRRGNERDVLRGILKKVRSPMWWARLSYPDREDYWNDEERRELMRWTTYRESS